RMRRTVRPDLICRRRRRHDAEAHLAGTRHLRCLPAADAARAARFGANPGGVRRDALRADRRRGIAACRSCGIAPVAPRDCAVWHTYASTEALFVASWQVPPDDSGPEATVAVGMPQANHDYALLDAADRRVARGEPGELVLRSRYLELGEWRQGRVVPGRMLPVPNPPRPPRFPPH